jgi:hypothetical protein
MTTRRSFLGAILAAGVAPAAIGSGILMPVRKIARVDPFGQFGFVQWDNFRFIESPMLYEDTPLRPGMHGYIGSPEHRAAQQELNRLRRQMMGTVALVRNTNPKAVVFVDDWVEPGRVVRRCLKPGEIATVRNRAPA